MPSNVPVLFCFVEIRKKHHITERTHSHRRQWWWSLFLVLLLLMLLLVVLLSTLLLFCVSSILFFVSSTAGLQRGGRQEAGASGGAVRGPRRRRERVQGEGFQERGGGPEEARDAYHRHRAAQGMLNFFSKCSLRKFMKTCIRYIYIYICLKLNYSVKTVEAKRSTPVYTTARYTVVCVYICIHVIAKG